MKHLSSDVLVIGSGPAGLAAACQARQDGAEQVLVIERNNEMGGILPQCIHNGFGVRVFESDLTGPEYAGRWIQRAREQGITFLRNTMVLEIDMPLGVVATNSELGLIKIKTKALVLAMGCRERPRGALAIPGSRPAGVYTAGTAQRLVNMEGYMPGSRFVILGSGDIGMIMARRLTIEGAQVVSMLEILPYISGLRRNLVQCLHDFDIPLSLRTTVTEVRGRGRVESVVVSQVDEHWQVVPGTQRELACDTLLLSASLVLKSALSRVAGVAIDPVTGGPYVDERYATSIPGIYAAGNVVHVYDIVDDVTESALRAGHYAASYAQHGAPGLSRAIPIVAGENVHHIVPHTIHRELLDGRPFLQFRVRRPIEAPVHAQVRIGDEVLVSKRLRYVRPSEMIALELQPALAPRLAQAEALQVVVE